MVVLPQTIFRSQARLPAICVFCAFFACQAAGHGVPCFLRIGGEFWNEDKGCATNSLLLFFSIYFSLITYYFRLIHFLLIYSTSHRLTDFVVLPQTSALNSAKSAKSITPHCIFSAILSLFPANLSFFRRVCASDEKVCPFFRRVCASDKKVCLFSAESVLQTKKSVSFPAASAFHPSIQAVWQKTRMQDSNISGYRIRIIVQRTILYLIITLLESWLRYSSVC